MYGYQIVRRLTVIPGLVISEGTIYPLLSRLKGQGHLSSTLVESPNGPARRTYALTDSGQKYLRAISGGWQEIVHAVDQCMKPSMPELTHETT